MIKASKIPDQKGHDLWYPHQSRRPTCASAKDYFLSDPRRKPQREYQQSYWQLVCGCGRADIVDVTIVWGIGHNFNPGQSHNLLSLTKAVNFRTHVKSCHPIIPGCLKLGNPITFHCFLMFSLSNSRTFGVLILHDFARNSM